MISLGVAAVRSLDRLCFLICQLLRYHGSTCENQTFHEPAISGFRFVQHGLAFEVLIASRANSTRGHEMIQKLIGISIISIGVAPAIAVAPLECCKELPDEFSCGFACSSLTRCDPEYDCGYQNGFKVLDFDEIHAFCDTYNTVVQAPCDAGWPGWDSSGPDCADGISSDQCCFGDPTDTTPTSGDLIRIKIDWETCGRGTIQPGGPG